MMTGDRGYFVNLRGVQGTRRRKMRKYVNFILGVEV